jgi:hypothetical protein
MRRGSGIAKDPSVRNKLAQPGQRRQAPNLTQESNACGLYQGDQNATLIESASFLRHHFFDDIDRRRVPNFFKNALRPSRRQRLRLKAGGCCQVCLFAEV